jgi:hypothetical protein
VTPETTRRPNTDRIKTARVHGDDDHRRRAVTMNRVLRTRSWVYPLVAGIAIVLAVGLAAWVLAS